ncbi:MAG TPA: hypothetical protein DCE80_06435, partial [Ignavibacteriales bacterium]|nr:hypothetical protein [Ignavibacteriales bacterium]
MKITFIRHGFLLSPFNDYGTLTLNELSRLALQIIDPTIDLIKTAKKIKKAGYLDKKYDKVFVSASKRTQDTAREINKYIDIPQFIISKELNEILFDPTQLITKAEYQN